MKIETVQLYKCDQSPEGKTLIILVDYDGWLWFWPLVKYEGYKTPFSSIDEVAVVYELTNLVKVKEFPFKGVEGRAGFYPKICNT